MCLIIVKPLGTPMTDDILKVAKGASRNNRDGFGYALKSEAHKESSLYLDKGYMDVDNMISAIEKLKIDENDELMIHLRMATHGKVMPKNTHPFIVTDNITELDTLQGVVNKPIVAHNGWFDITCHSDYSDTWTWVRNTLSKPGVFDAIIDTSMNFDPKVLKDELGYGNKLAIMFPDMEIQLIGNGWEEHNGVFYSNFGYKTHLKSNTLTNAYSCGYGCD